jgi:hypothetical protein
MFCGSSVACLQLSSGHAPSAAHHGALQRGQPQWQCCCPPSMRSVSYWLQINIKLAPPTPVLRAMCAIGNQLPDNINTLQGPECSTSKLSSATGRWTRVEAATKMRNGNGGCVVRTRPDLAGFQSHGALDWYGHGWRILCDRCAMVKPVQISCTGACAHTSRCHRHARPP